jgi:putative transposase
MKTSRFTETQIIRILKEQEQGISVKDIARQHGISEGTFYKWKAKYGGMDGSMIQQLKELEQENARLKKLYANQGLEIDALKDLLEPRSAHEYV